MMEEIVIGSDHAGYELKEGLKASEKFRGYEFIDVGTYSNESVDYPDYVSKVAKLVSEGKYGKGVTVCGSGIGASIVANKFRRIRAALCNDKHAAHMSREHNNANILALASRVISLETAEEILTEWLNTSFAGGRHKRRVDKITEIEKNNFYGIGRID